MSQYVVVSPEGKRFGPTDFQTLVHWARDGRVAPGMLVEDMLSGQTMTAAAVPGLFDGVAVTQEVSYPRVPATARNNSMASLVLGIIGAIAWCLPVVGLPVGLAAIIYGARSLQSEDRIKALIGLGLGIFCLMMSIVNAILGTILIQALS